MSNSDVPSKHPFPPLLHLHRNSVPATEGLTLTGLWFLQIYALSCMFERTEEGHLSHHQVEQPSGISQDDHSLSRTIQESMRDTYNDEERSRSVSFVSDILLFWVSVLYNNPSCDQAQPRFVGICRPPFPRVVLRSSSAAKHRQVASTAEKFTAKVRPSARFKVTAC